MGGDGPWAKWRVHLQQGGFVKLQSTKTGKYLRIFNNQIDVKGDNGPFCLFKIHRINGNNKIKLQSVKFPNQWISVTPQRIVKVGAGGAWCELAALQQGNQQKIELKEDNNISNDFSAKYEFAIPNTVVIRVPGQKTLFEKNGAAHYGGGTGIHRITCIKYDSIDYEMYMYILNYRITYIHLYIVLVNITCNIMCF